MQAEIDTQDTTLAISILGVNDAGYEFGNDGIASGRVLPWLQPAVGDDVWELWQAKYRDVVVLGPANERLFVFNLSEYNLSISDHYRALMDKLLDAANRNG